MSSLRERSGGFTVTELIITLFILAVAFSSFVTLFLTIDGVSDRTLDLARANDAAFTKMQEYENRDYADITVGSSGSGYEVEDFTDDLPEGLQNASGKVYVQYEGLSVTLKRVDVKVSYEYGNTEKLIEYANYIHVSGVGR